jgi:hypothetical protein
MRTPINIFSLLILFSIILINNAGAQSTSSIYSIYGLGNIEENSTGTNKGMGGTGIALPSEHSVNFLNPASYDGLDTVVTVFQLGFQGRYTKYSNYSNSQRLFDANFKYITMGLRVSKRLAASFGITTYSTIGYNINLDTQIDGSILTYTKNFTGSGGVNQVYLGGSYRLTKNLVLGVNAVYLFGNVTHTESSTTTRFRYELTSVDYLSNVNVNYGLNYNFAINKWKYNIGLTYNNGKKLITSNVTSIATLISTDTIRSSNNSFRIPRAIGIGLAARKDYFKIAADYEYKAWGSNVFTNSVIQSRNSNRYSLGIEFPSQGLNKGTNRMILYRFGAQYSTSYLVLKHTPINYRSVTVGAGIPLFDHLSVVNMAFEFGMNGSELHGLVRETFYTLHLDLSLQDIWFIKKKYF